MSETRCEQRYPSVMPTRGKGRRISDPAEMDALKALHERLVDFPGREELEVHVWKEGEEPPGPGLPDSPSRIWPMTLRHFRERLGGDEGELRGPRGSLHVVSVRAWLHEDPDKTFVQPVFTFIPDDSRMTEWKSIWEHHFKRFPPEL